MQIGGDSIYGQYFQGMIDEVRVYNVALTAAQIQSDMNTPIGCPDTQPPTAPTNLTATVSGSQVNLSWTASTDNVGVTGYLVERENPGAVELRADRDGDEHDAYSDIGVPASSTYSYRVRATDAAGNLSPYSNVAAGFRRVCDQPHVVTLTSTQTEQFTANATSVTWSVDGVVGGSATSGTITTTGLYTPPNSAGTHTVTVTTSDVSKSRIMQRSMSRIYAGVYDLSQ